MRLLVSVIHFLSFVKIITIYLNSFSIFLSPIYNLHPLLFLFLTTLRYVFLHLKYGFFLLVSFTAICKISNISLSNQYFVKFISQIVKNVVTNNALIFLICSHRFIVLVGRHILVLYSFRFFAYLV